MLGLRPVSSGDQARTAFLDGVPVSTVLDLAPPPPAAAERAGRIAHPSPSPCQPRTVSCRARGVQPAPRRGVLHRRQGRPRQRHAFTVGAHRWGPVAIPTSVGVWYGRGDADATRLGSARTGLGSTVSNWPGGTRLARPGALALLRPRSTTFTRTPDEAASPPSAHPSARSAGRERSCSPCWATTCSTRCAPPFSRRGWRVRRRAAAAGPGLHRGPPAFGDHREARRDPTPGRPDRGLRPAGGQTARVGGQLRRRAAAGQEGGRAWNERP